MNAQDVARMTASPGWRKHRNETFDTADGRVIVKGQRVNRSAWGYRVLNGMARAFNSPVLQAVPVHGGAQSQAVEVRRLQALDAAGVSVPKVMHVGPEFFAMQFMPGENLAQLMEDHPERAIDYWQQGLEVIQRTHARGQYLSQAQARNFVAASEGLIAIDFEDDPMEVMTLAQAQAHDWLVYLLSTVWLLPQPRSNAMSIWRAIAGDAQQVQDPAMQLLIKTTGRLGWMRHLPNKRKPWGRDIIGAQAAAEFLVEWVQSGQAHSSPR